VGNAAITPESLVAEVRDLVSLPDIAVQVNTLVEDPRTSAHDIGWVISRDPGLTARLLRVANSPFFGLSTRVATVDRAIAVIGVKPLRDLVLATASVRSFKGIPNGLVSMDDFWYHSLYCALAARLLARQRRLPHADSLFVAGLLHDIGQLVLFNRLPDASREVLRLAMDDPHTLDTHQAERKVHGFDHAQVGALLLRQWRLPPLVVECVAQHHAPTAARSYPVETAIVHIANVIATLAEINSTHLEDVPAIDPAAWKQAGIKDEVIEPTMREIQRQFREARSLFLADAA
jgi:putative nucleotidyltransferase with HDIG domain